MILFCLGFIAPPVTANDWNWFGWIFDGWICWGSKCEGDIEGIWYELSFWSFSEGLSCFGSSGIKGGRSGWTWGTWVAGRSAIGMVGGIWVGPKGVACLVLGGEICQYEDNWDVYEPIITSLYRDLVGQSVVKNSSGAVSIIARAFLLKKVNDTNILSDPDRSFYIVVVATLSWSVLPAPCQSEETAKP